MFYFPVIQQVYILTINKKTGYGFLSFLNRIGVSGIFFNLF